MEGIIPAWGKILRGYRPALSVEITRECPLRYPGCYAYGDEHLGGDITLRQVSDFKGAELVERFFKLIEEHRPLHVSIVGGEPLVRFRELKPDITLMDLQMPGMGGVEAIKAIRAEHPAARIVVLTTYDGDVQAVRALKAGAMGYLLKSSLRTEMLDAIHQIAALTSKTL